jgi:hypothetical protein
MAQNNNGLPEGTDTVIEAGGVGGSGGGSGRSGTTNQGGSPSTASNSTGARTSSTASESQTDSLITATTASTGTGTGGSSTGAGGSTGSGGSTGVGDSAATGGSTGTGAASDGSDSASGGSSSGGSGGIRGIVGNVSTKAKDEVTNRARGFVGDGLKSGSNTLGSIAGIIEDTVEQIGERLGPQYADYARTASDTINRYASTLENKDPDELVDDARDLIRKSPGVALAGAAIIGFSIARLLKAGIPEEGFNGTRDRQGDRTGSTR